jgi:hypothetical protein
MSQESSVSGKSYHIQSGFEAHLVSHSVVIRGTFPGDKGVGVCTIFVSHRFIIICAFSPPPPPPRATHTHHEMLVEEECYHYLLKLTNYNIQKHNLDYKSVGSQESSVSIVIGYGLGGWGLIPGRCKRFFSFPQHPDQLWGPPSLLSSGYWGLFRWG